MNAIFIPYRRFDGRNGQSPSFVLPRVLAQHEGLSLGAKLCWGALALYAGKNGTCFPSQAALAWDLGTSTRNIRNYLDELEGWRGRGNSRRQVDAERFICRVKRYDKHGRMTDGYQFIEHPIFSPGYRNNSSATYRNKRSARVPEQNFQGKRITTAKESTAREVQQSASASVVGVASASAKLITGDESQKMTIRPPCRDGDAGAFIAKTEKLTREKTRQYTPDGNQRTGNPQCLPMKAKSQSPPEPELYAPIAAPACETELEHLRRTLTAYMGAEPPKGFDRSSLLRARRQCGPNRRTARPEVGRKEVQVGRQAWT